MVQVCPDELFLDASGQLLAPVAATSAAGRTCRFAAVEQGMSG